MTSNASSASHAGTGAFAVGIATVAQASGQVLDTYFPSPKLGIDEAQAEAAGLSAAGTTTLSFAKANQLGGAALSASIGQDSGRGVNLIAVATRIDDLAAAPIDAYDGYLRLHLLSHRLVTPHSISVDGLFGVLNNVAWSNQGPIPIDGLEETRMRLRAEGRIVNITSIDKFPRMTDYVVPSGVRIADADRVRLGAHLAEGTTVMHEGFVNFNAGTLGASMVEGRISAGVTVGNGSDIGGGASIMGTLSGGGSEVISMGEGCLLGANSGLGISLGDGCVIEAGLYVTGGTIVTREDGSSFKARDLSGMSDLLFRRNSKTGTVEVLQRGQRADWGGLNAQLHAN